MKKLLSLLGAIGLVATSSATVVACDDKDDSLTKDFDITAEEWTTANTGDTKTVSEYTLFANKLGMTNEDGSKYQDHFIIMIFKDDADETTNEIVQWTEITSHINNDDNTLKGSDVYSGGMNPDNIVAGGYHYIAGLTRTGDDEFKVSIDNSHAATGSGILDVKYTGQFTVAAAK